MSVPAPHHQEPARSPGRGGVVRTPGARPHRRASERPVIVVWRVIANTTALLSPAAGLPVRVTDPDAIGSSGDGHR